MPVGSMVAFAIGEYSGEDDDDPNVATRDMRAPPQGSTAPWWWGTSDGGRGVRVVARHVHGCMVVGRAARLRGGVYFTVAITWPIF
jgi:hypothetical protein